MTTEPLPPPAGSEEIVKRDVWLLWHISARGQYLCAVDESEALALRHKRMILGQYEGEYATYDGPAPRLHIEKRVTNHCYGANGL